MVRYLTDQSRAVLSQQQCGHPPHVACRQPSRASFLRHSLGMPLCRFMIDFGRQGGDDAAEGPGMLIRVPYTLNTTLAMEQVGY